MDKMEMNETSVTTAATTPCGTGSQKYALPGSISQALKITKYELLNNFRSRRFFALMAIMIAIGALLTAIVGYYRPASYLTTPLGFFSNWWGSVTFIIILSGVFFGGDAISGEFQNKTGYFLVGNPIRRSSIYVGKWLAALIASLSIILIFTAITIGNELYYFGLNVPIQFGESFLFALVYLVAVLGVTFFFSSLFKTSMISIIVTIILFLFAFTLIADLVEGLAHIEPWFIITYGSGIITSILTVPYPPHTTPITGIIRGVAYTATVPEGLVIMFAYFIVTAILGLLIFEMKEFN